jgi:hypothetical protein
MACLQSMPEQRGSGFCWLGEHGNKKNFATVEYYFKEAFKKRNKVLEFEVRYYFTLRVNEIFCLELLHPVCTYK